MIAFTEWFLYILTYMPFHGSNKRILENFLPKHGSISVYMYELNNIAKLRALPNGKIV